jgi:putative transposase
VFLPLHPQNVYTHRILKRISLHANYRPGAPRVGLTRGGLPLMPKNLKRYYGRGDLHFVTFSCYRRLPLLGTIRARNVFVHALEKIRERYGFLLVGYVVMPNHVHLLVSEPPKGTPAVVLEALKQRVSRDLRRNERHAAAGQSQVPPKKSGEELPRFWQPRFYDFNVYSAKKRREKLEYMHANPVERGLVNDPAAWMWSSYSFYEKGEPGVVKIDPVA